MTKQHNTIWYYLTILCLLLLLLPASIPLSATEPEIIVKPSSFTVGLIGGDTVIKNITVTWTGDNSIQCFISTNITSDCPGNNSEGIDVTYSEPSPFNLPSNVDYTVNMTIKAAINIMPEIYTITTTFSCTEPENIPPIADFTYSPENPTANDVISFTDTSTDADGTIVSWIWDFGDGATSTDRNPTYQYTNAGIYMVSLTVTDDDGATDSVEHDVTVFHYVGVQARWNLFSNLVDEPIDKTDIIVRYDGTDYTWDQAVEYGYILKYIYGWDGNAYTFEDILVPGEGYWIWSNRVCEFLIPSNVVPDNHITDLDASWNLVGLPYDTGLDKTDLSIQYLGQYYTWDAAVTKGYIIDFVYGWDRTSQNYVLCGTFDLGYGYWIYSYVGCALKIS